jgi:hypothetical protein
MDTPDACRIDLQRLATYDLIKRHDLVETAAYEIMNKPGWTVQ